MVRQKCSGIRRSYLEPYLQFINSHPMLCKGIQNELCKILSNQKTH